MTLYNDTGRTSDLLAVNADRSCVRLPRSVICVPARSSRTCDQPQTGLCSWSALCGKTTKGLIVTPAGAKVQRPGPAGMRYFGADGTDPSVGPNCPVPQSPWDARFAMRCYRLCSVGNITSGTVDNDAGAAFPGAGRVRPAAAPGRAGSLPPEAAGAAPQFLKLLSTTNGGLVSRSVLISTADDGLVRPVFRTRRRLSSCSPVTAICHILGEIEQTALPQPPRWPGYSAPLAGNVQATRPPQPGAGKLVLCRSSRGL